MRHEVAGSNPVDPTPIIQDIERFPSLSFFIAYNLSSMYADKLRTKDA